MPKAAHPTIIRGGLILLATAAVMAVLPAIPGYLKDASHREDFLPLTAGNIAIFVAFSALLIGVFAGVHRLFSGEYGRLRGKRSLLFFVPLGTMVGVVLGEGANPVMLLPYGVLMTVYGLLYRRFDPRLVALSGYLAGVLIENAMNRSPLQAPTLMWAAFFIVPYFATRTWEDRRRIEARRLIRTVGPLAAASPLLAVLAWWASVATSDAGGGSPPLVFLAALLPFVLGIPYLLASRAGLFGRADAVRLPVPGRAVVPLIALGATLAALAWLATSEGGRTSPPLIVVGALLPFLIAVPWTLTRRRRTTA
ncbi:MAG: hypothetical protein V3S18_02615 [Dehalococcoidia bacterium]